MSIESIGFILSYVMSFLYTFIATHPISMGPQILLLFSMVFCAFGSSLFQKSKATSEHNIWLFSLFLILVSIISGRNRVWGEYAILLSHAFAVYWLEARSGQLIAGESSEYLFIDLMFGFVVLPFRHFFQRFKTLILFTSTRLGKDRSLPAKVIILIVLIISIILLYTAGNLLSQADTGFRQILGSLFNWVRLENIRPTLFRFLISLPIGAYLYGLFFGLYQEQAKLRPAWRERWESQLLNLRHVPTSLWSSILSVFALLYVAFFLLQGSYLFGAFFRTLPVHMTAAQYARQGFFELCAITTLNFALLGFAWLSHHQPIRHSTAMFSLFFVILGESVVFSMIAASKLLLYIQRFGFTPLRIQSFWFIGVLLAACLAASYSLLTGKRSYKIWILYSGVSLAITQIL